MVTKKTREDGGFETVDPSPEAASPTDERNDLRTRQLHQERAEKAAGGDRGRSQTRTLETAQQRTHSRLAAAYRRMRSRVRAGIRAAHLAGPMPRPGPR